MEEPKFQDGEVLVQFNDGQYGLRRGIRGSYEYLDIKRENAAYWWGESHAVKYCRGTKNEIYEAYTRKCDVGVPVQEPVDDAPEPKDKRNLIWRLLFPKGKN